MSDHITGEDRINLFFNAISDTNELSNQLQKKEFIKLYGTFCEVLEGDALPYLPKIVP